MKKSRLEKILSDYDYKFPPEAVAEKPAHPRDSAKLLVYDRKSGKVDFDIFKNLGDYLPENSVLVLNDTKVIPARIAVKKETGGVIKILYVRREGGSLIFLSPQKLFLGQKLFMGKAVFTVLGQEGSEYHLRPSFPAADIFKFLEKHGETPLPPYIKNTGLTGREIKKEYQTVFARVRGSIAAPTASLHFTKKLLADLKKRGVKIAYITLHVGLGTFAPLTEENMKNGKLHEEHYEINPRAAKILNDARKRGGTIIPVGTTALRTLESAAKGGELKSLIGETKLFIQEGYRFKFADGMITNFHVPRSSLMMLVSALVGRKKLLDLYASAIRDKFRLFSFGDGMLIK